MDAVYWQPFYKSWVVWYGERGEREVHRHVLMEDVSFPVDLVARQAMLDSGIPTVHARAIGTVVAVVEPSSLLSRCSRIRYQPTLVPFFFDVAGHEVTGAAIAYLRSEDRSLWALGLIYGDRIVPS